MEIDIDKELKRIQELADNIWFKADRILTDPKRIAERPDRTPIEKLGLSIYAMRCLTRREIEYVEQLPKNKNDLLRIRGIGEQTANEILGKIKSQY